MASRLKCHDEHTTCDFADFQRTITNKDLPKVDKLRVVEFLADELATEEQVNLSESGKDYPIGSPYHTFEAGNT